MAGQAELLQWGQGGTELMLPCNFMSRLFCSGEKKKNKPWFQLICKEPMKIPLMERWKGLFMKNLAPVHIWDEMDL